MKYLEKYTGLKTYMYPSGKIADKERVLRDFEAALTFPHVVETDENGQVMFGFYNLSALRTQYEIDPELGENEAIVAIQNKMNEPAPEPSNDPTAEERIAAALEYQNMLA